MKKLLLILFVLTLAMTNVGCLPSSPPPPPPPGGFAIGAVTPCTGNIFTTLCAMPDIEIMGLWQRDLPGAVGNQYQIPPNSYTCSDALACTVGELYVSGGRVPAVWNFVEGYNSACFNMSTTVAFTSPFVTLTCTGGPGGLTGYAIDPTTMYTSSPPPSATITGGGGIDPTYGMPLVQYFDPTGTLQGQAYATYVSPDGTSLSGPVPNFSSAPSGAYAGVISNAGPNNSYIPIGAATVEVVVGCP
jgi:hypothetical protein